MTTVGRVASWVLSTAPSPSVAPSTSPISGGSTGVQIATLVVAVLAIAATIVSAWLLRRTGKGTVDAAKDSAKAAHESAEAAQKAAEATTKAAQDLETRSRREEVMRSLRWAADLALSKDDTSAQLGVSQLKALSESNLSDDDVQAFVDAALNAVVDPVADVLEQNPDAQVDPPDGESDEHDSSGSGGDAQPSDTPVDSSPTVTEEAKGDE